MSNLSQVSSRRSPHSNEVEHRLTIQETTTDRQGEDIDKLDTRLSRLEWVIAGLAIAITGGTSEKMQHLGALLAEVLK